MMKTNIPKQLLRSKYRREMWVNAQSIIKKLEKILPISAAYLIGSFTTKKSRPADVDFIILLQINEKRKKSKWSVDFVIAPDNEYGQLVLADADKWVQEKYGLKKSAMIKIKG